MSPRWKEIDSAHNLMTNPPVLDQNEDNEDAQPLVTSKRRRAITDAERKALRDYYLDPANGKLTQKVTWTWFLQGFRHLPQYKLDKNPLKTINVLQAIRWSIDAWGNDVSQATIENCWVKSRVLSSEC